MYESSIDVFKVLLILFFKPKNKSHLLTLDNEPIAAGVSMGILPIGQ